LCQTTPASRTASSQQCESFCFKKIVSSKKKIKLDENKTRVSAASGKGYRMQTAHAANHAEDRYDYSVDASMNAAAWPAVAFKIQACFNRATYDISLAEVLLLAHHTHADNQCILRSMGTSDVDEADLLDVQRRLSDDGDGTARHYSQTCVEKIQRRVQNNKRLAFMEIVHALSYQVVTIYARTQSMLLCANEFRHNFRNIDAEWEQAMEKLQTSGGKHTYTSVLWKQCLLALFGNSAF